jgi:hypothetical protein
VDVTDVGHGLGAGVDRVEKIRPQLLDVLRIGRVEFSFFRDDWSA